MSLFNPNEKKGVVGPTMRPTPSLFTSVGQTGRRAFDTTIAAGKGYANVAARGLETAINASTAKPRLVGGAVVDAVRGFTGAPTRHNAGAALPGVSLPRPFGPPAVAATTAAPAAAAQPAAPFSDVRSTTTVQAPRPAVAATPAAATAPAASTLVPGARTLDGRPGGLASSVDANGVPTYDNASIERLNARVSQPGNGGGVAAQSFGGPAAPAAAPIVAAPQAQAATLTLPRQLSGDLAGAETERQARLSDIDSSLFGLRGKLNSRGRRELYTNLLGMQNQLTRDRVDQVTGLETEGARLANAGATEQARLLQQANEGNADRIIDAHKFNIGVDLVREERAEKGGEIKNLLRGADGGTSLLRSDGRLTPLTTIEGQHFREADPLPGEITNNDLFEAYRGDVAAVNKNELLKPEERDAQLAAIEAQPEYQVLLGNLRKPTLQRFLEAARPLNPSASDSDLADFFRRRYGEGRAP